MGLLPFMFWFGLDKKFLGDLSFTPLVSLPPTLLLLLRYYYLFFPSAQVGYFGVLFFHFAGIYFFRGFSFFSSITSMIQGAVFVLMTFFFFQSPAGRHGGGFFYWFLCTIFLSPSFYEKFPFSFLLVMWLFSGLAWGNLLTAVALLFLYERREFSYAFFLACKFGYERTGGWGGARNGASWIRGQEKKVKKIRMEQGS